MTQWTMVADLRRCVGCQTCTAACKHTNATAPAVQWRRVLDIETGSYPDVGRTFVPVGCMHCEDPPCMHVCPSTATGQRDDGIVTIDYDICIGCAYCAVACPYQARYKVDKPRFAYARDGRMRNEAAREDPARIGVAQKCTFCSDRIDFGLENGLTPGLDPRATPACVNACIADALHFGDADDPDSNVSTMLAENASFRMHAELETSPNFHYVWDTAADNDDDVEPVPPELPASGVGGVGAAAPWLQQHWDWRAAGNFIGGGTGSGLMIASGILGFTGVSVMPWALLSLFFVGLGLFLVFLETGRPLRAPLNVFFHPQTSWMTREAMTGVALFGVGLLAAFSAMATILALAGVVGAAFLYCQARILTEAKGIPAWRNPAVTALIVTTGLVEGAGVFALGSMLVDGVGAPKALAALVLVFLGARAWAWRRYRKATAGAVPDAAQRIIQGFDGPFMYVGNLLPALLTVGYVIRPDVPVLVDGAAFAAVVMGWWLKFMLITRAAYNQGFALVRQPEKGGGAGPGARPGWEA